MNPTNTTGLVTDMAGVLELAGARLGPTEWSVMTQETVDAFADLTGDRNFIHVDPERAATTNFGGTIAHGLLTLSLLAPVTQQLQVTDAGVSINYGLEKVRFPAPLRVGASWRAVAEVLEVSEIPGGVQANVRSSVELQDGDKPAVVAEFVLRYYR